MKVVLLISFLLITVSLGQDRIVFERRLDANDWEIFLMNANGLFQRNLTQSPTSKDIEPRISPDGKQMVFSSDRNAPGYELYVMDLTGSHSVRQITDDFYVDHSPSWSPDGRKIVFGRCNPDMTLCDIFTVNANGVGTPVPMANSLQDDDYPSFSPDGSQIVFASNRDGNYEIYKCNADGTGVQRLTTNTVSDGWPSWSPNGTKIIFASLLNASDYELYMMNPDGSNLVRLTHNNGSHDYRPDFSSDGLRVVWTRAFGSTYEIVEAPFGSLNQPNRLTFNTINDLSPDYGFVTRKVGRSR